MVNRLGSRSITTTVLLGFALTFGIWLVASYLVTARVSETKQRSDAITARYMSAQELLTTVRSQVLLASVSVRDTLLDPVPQASESSQRVEDAYVAVTQALASYVPVVDSGVERDRLVRLRQEADAFRSAMLRVLSTDSRQWLADARTLLRTQVVPRRDAVIRLSEQIQAMNRSAFVKQQTEITGIYAASQRQFWWTLSLALAASLAIALLAIGRARQLEESLQEQMLRDAQNARDLQHLSAKLVTAQEEERRAIARELHDEVGQGLTAIKVELAVAEREIEAAGFPHGLLADARSITDGALTTVRDIAQLLRPALLDDLGLEAAIESYLGGFGRRHRLQTELVPCSHAARLAPEIETSIYRIVQEGLTNVAKHASATRCRVSLGCGADTVTLTIEDDGVGFDVAGVERAGSGLGLIGMRERALQLRGTVRFDSAPGWGTRLTVELPAHNPASDSSETPAPGRLAEARVVEQHG